MEPKFCFKTNKCFTDLLLLSTLSLSCNYRIRNLYDHVIVEFTLGSCKGFVTVNFDLTGWVTKIAIVPTVDDEIIKNVGST